MMDGFQFITGGALLFALAFAARRVVRRQRPRLSDLGFVSDQWKAELWLRRDDPGREP